jgi:hypothetical protein
MELEPTRTLLEELRERMPTREPSAARSSSPGHWIVRVFPGVEAAFQI